MDPDLLFITGLIVGMFSVPSLIAAWVERRAPWFALFGLLVTSGLIFLAFRENPDGYTLAEIPDLLVTVVARYLF